MVEISTDVVHLCLMRIKGEFKLATYVTWNNSSEKQQMYYCGAICEKDNVLEQ